MNNFSVFELSITCFLNSGRYDLTLIKSYLIPYLIRDKEQETPAIKIANDFISFKFDDVQFLDKLKFLGGATTLDSFLKAYTASETKGIFTYDCLITQTLLSLLNCHHMKPFSVNLYTTIL